MTERENIDTIQKALRTIKEAAQEEIKRADTPSVRNPLTRKSNGRRSIWPIWP